MTRRDRFRVASNSPESITHLLNDGVSKEDGVSEPLPRAGFLLRGPSASIHSLLIDGFVEPRLLRRFVSVAFPSSRACELDQPFLGYHASGGDEAPSGVTTTTTIFINRHDNSNTTGGAFTIPELRPDFGEPVQARSNIVPSQQGYSTPDRPTRWSRSNYPPPARLRRTARSVRPVVARALRFD